MGLKSLTLIGVLSREKTSNLKVNSFKILQLHEKQFFFVIIDQWLEVEKPSLKLTFKNNAVIYETN